MHLSIRVRPFFLIKSLFASYVTLICPLFSPPASQFLNLGNDDTGNVRANLEHLAEEGDGQGSVGLFNVNPRVTEALNEVTHIYSGLENINDLSQSGPPQFDYTPQQQVDVHPSPNAHLLCNNRFCLFFCTFDLVFIHNI
jgi:hypothetical protein